VPAAAASGPAPDAAAAAPFDGALLQTLAQTVTSDPTSDATAPAVAPSAAAAAAVGLDQLSSLGSIGSFTSQVSNGPSAANELLSTGAGRSVAVVCALLAAIGIFLVVHRRADRGDLKLAAARNGSDVARFR
jgi:hypothetical protein